MTAQELYHEAARRGLRLEPAGDKLAVIPKGKCPPEFAEVLRQNKSELLRWLSSSLSPGWQAVPPADLPLNPACPRPNSADARRVMDHVVRQLPPDGQAPGPLCEWCMRREMAYWREYHWSDALCAYAAARDVACWQLGRSERDLCQLLGTLTEATPCTAQQAQKR